MRKKDNLKNSYEFSFEKATEFLIQEKMIRQMWITNEFSNLSLIPYDELFEKLNSLIKEDSSIFLKQPV